MKIIVVITFISTHLFAAQYFAYPKSKEQRQYMVSKLKAKRIFTTKEQSFIDDSDIKNAFKFDSNVEQIQQIIKNCKNCNIEKATNAISFNRYSSDQWYLENAGELFKRWISDIDVTYIQGVKHEDIQLLDNEKINTSKIRVAIVDSGIDLMHPDLKGQIYEDKNECRDLKKYNLCLNTNADRNSCHKTFANIDHNSNGYPLDCNGWNITGKSNPSSQVTGSADISDRDGHGTHIAGIIAAKDNTIGIKGIAQHIELLPIQVGVASRDETSQELPTDNIAKGILYAIKNKAQIINLSLGWRINQDSLLMRKMIEQAQANDILIVAAAGNDAHDETVYPCSYQGVICVAAHDVNGELSTFSNFGAHVDLLAPGNSILSTYPTNKRSKTFTKDVNYEYLSGTSQAAPQVVGVLARLLNQGFSSQEAKSKLLNGARPKKKSHKWIRFGNLSYKDSLKASSNISELVSKTPALINVSKNKEFQFSVRVFEKTNISIFSNDFEFLKSKWTIDEKAGETILKSSIKNKSLTKKSYFIDVNFKSANFDKTYTLQINPIIVVSTLNKSNLLLSYPVEFKKDFDPDLVRVIDNNYDAKVDYIAIKQNDTRTFVKVITEDEGKYKMSEAQLVSDKKSIILNISKIDLNLDGQANYVITLVDLSSKERKTFFKVYDDDMKPSDLLITPDNTYNNSTSTLPGSFKWTRIKNSMKPTWIGFGLDPNYVTSSPWEIERLENKKSYRLFHLDSKKGVITSKMPKNLYPVSFLYQSKKDSQQATLYFLATKDLGYKKTYSLYRLQDAQILFIESLAPKTYFDIFNAKSLPLSSSNNSNAFFYVPSNQGSQKVIALEVLPTGLKVVESKLGLASSEPLIRVLRYDMNSNAIAQTASKLVVFTKNNIQKIQSYTNAKRIKHYLLQTELGVMLSQKETFNLSSHTVIVDTKKEQISEPARLQTFATDGCLEIEIEKINNEEFISYFCQKNKRILKIKVSL